MLSCYVLILFTCIKFHYGVASGRMNIYFDNIEKIMAKVIICGEYCTYKTSEQIRDSVEYTQECFIMASQHLCKRHALQSRSKRQQQSI